MKKESDAYFTVEAAILYPIILSVILLMTYLLLFQYDRCLLEQDIGKATVLSGSKWTLTKEQLNDYMQADRISPVFWLRRSRNVQNKRDNTEENN